jgi:hypothetical protein
LRHGRAWEAIETFEAGRKEGVDFDTHDHDIAG